MLLGSLFTLLPYRFFKLLIHQSLEKLDSVYIQKLSQSYSHGLTLQNLKGYRAFCKRQKTGSKDHTKVLELKAKINIMKFTKVFFCHSFLLQVFFSVRRSSSISRIFLYQYNFLILVEVWLNVRVFVYELSGCWFKSCCCHLSFRYCTCFEQDIP